MSVALRDEPEVLHALPGRLRVHLPGWSGEGQRNLESRLRRLTGVLSARANALTSNVLITFDPAAADVCTLLARLPDLVAEAASDGQEEPPPPALHERTGDIGRARIAMRGMDRDPGMVRRVVDYLGQRPGVIRVVGNELTGRVLVEFSHRDTTLEDILAEVARVELPATAGEDRPEHPLDPAPLVQSAVRLAGATLGLAYLAARRLTGSDVSPGLRQNAVGVAAVAGVLQSFPVIRNGLRHLLGRNAAELVFAGPTITALTLAGSPLGLALTAAESASLLTEVLARRAAWHRYEENLATVAVAHPGEVIRLETGDRTPLDCTVIEGFGTAVGRDGLPEPVSPGGFMRAGSRLYGGPCVVELVVHEGFTPEPRPAPPRPTVYQRYLRLLNPMALGYAAVTALVTRSLSRTFQAFLLVNPRTAMIGAEAASTGASARVLRAGVTVVGTRPQRVIRRPNALLLAFPRLLSDGFELTRALPLEASDDPAEILVRASAVAAAAGSPWGGTVAAGASDVAEEGAFDGTAATASIGGIRYSLRPVDTWDGIAPTIRRRFRGEVALLLRSDRQERPIGVLGIRPRLAPGIDELLSTCRRHGVELGMLHAGDQASAEAMSRRTGIALVEGTAVEAIRERHSRGEIVTFASDSAHAAHAFEACDLAVAVTSGRTSRFPARADLLAPDLFALAAIVEAGARRDAAVRDSVGLSALSNLFGAAWGLRSPVGVARASYAVHVTALGAIAGGWLRLRGGERPLSSIARLVDPRPERWGRRSIPEVLRVLKTSANGLTDEEALTRRQTQRPPAERSAMLNAVLAQLRSPLTAVLGAGAVLSIILGSTADVVVIGATILANIAVGAWQERQTGQAIAALERIGTSTARVLRDGDTVEIATGEIVPGDILVLAPGDRIAADARLLTAQNLEVDESALTGESLPVPKSHDAPTDAGRIVLAGSDVTVGSALAIVVAIGRRTRMGATAAALALDETRASPLGVRLNRMLRQILPLAGVGGVIVLLSGIVRRRPVLPQLAIGASIAIAAAPEGLPLLAGVGEAAVARRLAGRRALVRRLSAVEALGRVDVACTDKTGTLTEGRLALHVVASSDEEAGPRQVRSPSLRNVLAAAALATPHPEAADAGAHPTDIAITDGAQSAGLGEQLLTERDAELPFDPARSYHATLIGERLYVKGATEVLLPRCNHVRHGDTDRPLDDAGRETLSRQAQRLAERGLRVLMVAEGPSSGGSIEQPQNLVALGFVGISDPLRPEVPEAVRRCHEAGVRVIMLTGDHPATARAIASEAGILGPRDEVVTGPELAELENGALDQRLDHVTVIARVTPIDKLRIIESLQRGGHTVAMTGDGVNDAPALRLADVGVAMGRAGTEVARQAADVVLADDNFSTLVEALVEGRSFWRNIRRALALLLGGNLGELGLVVGASAMGLAPPLLTRQILAVNLVTDVLPSLAVALQPPESRRLSRLAREGTAALDTPLRREVRRRGIATAAPSLAAFLATLRSSGLTEARSVAFASVVTTQLAQTLDNGRSEGSLTRSVFSAVAASAGVLLFALTVPPLRAFLGLVTPGPAGWLYVGGATLAALVLGRGFTMAAPAV